MKMIFDENSYNSKIFTATITSTEAVTKSVKTATGRGDAFFVYVAFRVTRGELRGRKFTLAFALRHPDYYSAARDLRAFASLVRACGITRKIQDTDELVGRRVELSATFAPGGNSHGNS